VSLTHQWALPLAPPSALPPFPFPPSILVLIRVFFCSLKSSDEDLEHLSYDREVSLVLSLFSVVFFLLSDPQSVNSSKGPSIKPVDFSPS